jgi:hypothetical protein
VERAEPVKELSYLIFFLIYRKYKALFKVKDSGYNF